AYSPLAVACTTFVEPPPVVHVIAMSLPCGCTEMIRKPEALLFGSVPARNSARLFMPSPSGSSVGAEPGQLFVQPKCACSHCWYGVNGETTPRTASALVAAPVALLTSTEYVPALVPCTPTSMSAEFVALGIGEFVL